MLFGTGCMRAIMLRFKLKVIILVQSGASSWHDEESQVQSPQFHLYSNAHFVDGQVGVYVCVLHNCTDPRKRWRPV